MLAKNENTISIKLTVLLIGLINFIFISAETLADEAPDGLLVINGAAEQGQVLTADVSGIRDAYSQSGFSYQWLRNGVAISGATSTTYQLVQADVATKISLWVQYVKVNLFFFGVTYKTLTSAETAIVANINDNPQGFPAISGIAKQNQVLTAVTSNITDIDGLGTAGFRYQWLRNGSVIPGATLSSYTLAQADVETFIGLVVSYIDGGNTLESINSTQTAAVINVNDTPVGAPVISGNLAQKQVLTVKTSAISDVDGLGSFSYQWLRSGVKIIDATDTTYTLAQADVDTFISVTVSYTDGGGKLESLTSVKTSAVININDKPVGLPTISGSLIQGGLLTVDASDITDVDGLGSFSYQWFRGGNIIVAATASTYRLVQADVASLIRVRVNYTDGGNTVESVSSARTAAVANVNDLPVGLPVISGSLLQNQVLTVDTSAISDIDGLGAGGFRYQWLRAGEIMVDATDTSYTLTQADVNAFFSVIVYYTDGGNTDESVTSTQTAAVANVNDLPVGVPLITGRLVQGQILSVDTSGISDTDGLGAFSYQWLRSEAVIVDATGSSYTLGQADVNAFISVVVSYTDGGLTDESIHSNTLAPVENINDIGVVSIVGQATEASELTVDVITDTDGTSSSIFLYQWLRDGAVIAGATGDRYTLNVNDLAKTITLRVFYTDDLGTDEVVFSNVKGPVFPDLPKITPPADSGPVNATGWFTFVDLNSADASAVDGLDGVLMVTSDANGQFRPGETLVTWSATDSAGNVGTAIQRIKVVPLVEVSKNQRSTEGASATFKVILNGDALEYPVIVPYIVNGTSDGNDHTLTAGKVKITEPAAGELPEQSVSFEINNDDITEGLETVVITLGSPEMGSPEMANAVLGSLTTHTVEITEGNVAPLVSFNSAQLAAGNILLVDPAAGKVTVSAIATDANTDDLVYNWSATDNALIDDDGLNGDSRFVFDPTLLSPGFYSFHVSVSDATETVETELMLRVLSAAPALATADSDNDGINDETEGFGDADGDGVADYLDAIGASQVLQQKTAISNQFLIQTEPGLRLSLGEIVFKAGQGSSQVTQTEMAANGFAVDDIGNVGGYFDFTVSGLPIAGQSAQVVIPQLAAMPRSSVYRKLTATGWQDFVKDSNNSVASAAGEEGYCPPPGHAAYQPGLNQGHWCLQLSIEDGGPNDSDGIVNNRITDPGGVGQILTDISVSSSGGGGGAWHPLLPALSIFIMLFFRNRLNMTAVFYGWRKICIYTKSLQPARTTDLGKGSLLWQNRPLRDV